MNVKILKRFSTDKKIIRYTLEWGKDAGQRMSTGIFTYTRPKDQIEKNHNKEALAILETKRSQMIIDHQSIGTGYIPQHKIKGNFLDYYNDFINLNVNKGNRHLQGSLSAFKGFINKDFISPVDITERFCIQFRDYLLKKFNGETPSGYFMRFKRVLKAATKEGYFRFSPAEDIAAKMGSNKKIKDILTSQEYAKLMQVPCLNYEVKKAFVFSLYTGLRWADIKPLKWEDVRHSTILISQKKTGVSLELPLHEVASKILGERKEGLVFKLPTADGANKVLRKWCDDAGLKKHITWHCARHSFSVLLQQSGVDQATVAGMLVIQQLNMYNRPIKDMYKLLPLRPLKSCPNNQPIACERQSFT